MWSLDPYKGYSNDYYRSITLYSDKRSDILDGLSTALFNVDNLLDIETIINNVESKYSIQKEINDNTVEVYYNQGFKDTIKEYKGEESTIDGNTRVTI